jgi:hypothetical protein
MTQFPSTDLQFVAQMLRRTRAQDQITAGESRRLDEIADHGRTITDPEAPVISGAVPAPHEVPHATRARGPVD